MDIKISLIGQDGRVRWMEKKKAEKLVKSGRFKFISNPTQEYYPQHDKASKKHNPNVEPTLLDEEGKYLDVDVL